MDFLEVHVATEAGLARLQHFKKRGRMGFLEIHVATEAGLARLQHFKSVSEWTS
jgi:hypothetical protein